MAELYRVKPQDPFEAMQFDGTNAAEILEWIGGDNYFGATPGDDILGIQGNGWSLQVNRGGWILRQDNADGTPARFYTASNDLFTARYEAVRSDNALVEHFRRELTLAGEDPDVVEWYLEIARKWAIYGHSGTSTEYALPILYKLLKYENLSPLTDDPSEWRYHNEEVWGQAGGVWQNIRNPKAFSRDGGKTYSLVGEGGVDDPQTPVYTSQKKGT